MEKLKHYSLLDLYQPFLHINYNPYFDEKIQTQQDIITIYIYYHECHHALNITNLYW